MQSQAGLAIEELAECIKELIRVIQLFPNFEKLDDRFKLRLEQVYSKAVIAKNRVHVK